MEKLVLVEVVAEVLLFPLRAEQPTLLVENQVCIGTILLTDLKKMEPIGVQKLEVMV